MVKYFFLFCLICNVSQAATWKKISTNVPAIPYTGTAGTSLTAAQCPTNYVLVPALAPYSASEFCIMKYEVKSLYGTVISEAAGTPLTSNRTSARTACQALGYGYDLISNEQWQAVARNIAAQSINWSSGIVGQGQLNQGHSDTSPGAMLPADSDDNVACSGTGQVCSSTVWNSQRRTHVLSNGSVVWDIGGNAQEWVASDIPVAVGATEYMSNLPVGDIRQTRYGPDTATICETPAGTPWCGMGQSGFSGAATAIMRGGFFNGAANIGGIFTVTLVNSGTTGSYFSYRCVFTK